MNRILYYLVYCFLWLITLLPIGLLYGISDFLYFMLYYIVRYRRKTVLTNLQLSFPDKTSEEIQEIARKSYLNLTDNFLEWMFRIHMGEKEISRRFVYKNPELLEEFLAKDKSIMLYMSHFGNWEWTYHMPRISGYTVLAVYKPLENKYFDTMFLNLRGKFGVKGIPMASTLRQILEHQRKGIPFIMLNLADQRPEWLSIQHWTRFLNQDTPVITGAEKIVRKYDMVPIQLHIDRVRRGYYEAEFKILCDNPSESPEFEITRKYLGYLEKSIIEKPESYLWTHKRWKYTRKDAKNPIDLGPLIS